VCVCVWEGAGGGWVGGLTCNFGSRVLAAWSNYKCGELETSAVYVDAIVLLSKMLLCIVFHYFYQ
jgi:hypothetical protein